jgi:hypothetical protein
MMTTFIIQTALAIFKYIKGVTDPFLLFVYFLLFISLLNFCYQVLVEEALPEEKQNIAPKPNHTNSAFLKYRPPLEKCYPCESFKPLPNRHYCNRCPNCDVPTDYVLLSMFYADPRINVN